MYLHTVKWLNSFILPIDGTLAGAATPGQNEPGSNDNEGVLYIPQYYILKPSDAVKFHIQDTS